MIHLSHWKEINVSDRCLLIKRFNTVLLYFFDFPGKDKQRRSVFNTLIHCLFVVTLIRDCVKITYAVY